jgi:SUKH-4 immunity protein of toxin-antitoxin system
MDLCEAIAIAAKRLPGEYEPLQLTFYGERSRPSRDHVVIGDDYGTELRVRLSDGAVVSIAPDGQLPSRFVNSSIERLASFIDAYRSYAGPASADADVAPLVRQLREQLTGIDPAALDDCENWWAVVLEQAEGGLL